MRKLSMISVLLSLIWVLTNPETILANDATDDAAGKCLDDYIATGRYFLIDPTTGQLNVQKSSLKLVTTCQGPVSAWINQCEKETRNSYGCTQGAMQIAQMLLLDGWKHRSDLKKWHARSDKSVAPQESNPAPVEGHYTPPSEHVQNSKPLAVQPEVQQESKPVPVENPNPPAQPPSVVEIDQQAITLWNQKRYSDAIPLFNQACNSGKTNSCYALGLIYDFGRGVAQDFPRATAFYSKACNAGNGVACYHLSMLQYPGQSGGMPCSRAVTLNLSRSCDMGIATSCSEVGLSYIHGCGVTKDTEKGQQLLSKGCSLGDYNACDGIK